MSQMMGIGDQSGGLQPPPQKFLHLRLSVSIGLPCLPKPAVSHAHGTGLPIRRRGDEAVTAPAARPPTSNLRFSPLPKPVQLFASAGCGAPLSLARAGADDGHTH